MDHQAFPSPSPTSAPPAAHSGCAARRGSVGDAAPKHPERRDQALEYFYEGRYRHCLEELPPLEDSMAGATAQARTAACQAFLGGRIQPAIRRCEELLHTAPERADLYCILGTLLRKVKQSGRAYETLRAGFRVDPRHQALLVALRSMGVRRPPVLGFLGRAHPANRILGRLRSRLFPTP